MAWSPVQGIFLTPDRARYWWVKPVLPTRKLLSRRSSLNVARRRIPVSLSRFVGFDEAPPAGPDGSRVFAASVVDSDETTV